MYKLATPRFWALIYLFSFNLPASGFPRPVIRPTQTLNTHFHHQTCQPISFSRTDTCVLHIHARTHIKVALSLSGLGGPLHTLAPSAVRVSQTGQRKGREEGKKKKKVKYSVVWIVDRRRCWQRRHSSLNWPPRFKSICQVKAALSLVKFWQTQVGPWDRCLISFFNFRNFTGPEIST